MRNAGLFEALREYAEAALPVLRHVYPSFRVQLEAQTRWARRDATHFERIEDRSFDLWGLLDEAGRHLRQLPQHAAAVSQLVQGPVVQRHLHRLVGTCFSAGTYDENYLLKGVMHDIAYRSGGLQYEEDAFVAAYATLEETIYGDELAFDLIAPLIGPRGDGYPVVLGDNLALDRLTDEELSLCLSAGFFSSLLGPSTFARVSPCGLRFRYTLPKVFGEDADDSRQLRETIRSHEELIDRVLRTLRLFKAGRVSAPGILHMRRNLLAWEDDPRWEFLAGGGEWLNAYELTPETCRHLEEFWTRLSIRAVTRHKALTGAIRRFGIGVGRARRDDEIVDLMIAAESLFLTDTGAAADRGELRFRLALRAAYYLTNELDERKRIFGFMKRAYDVRSQIVHGGEPSDLRGPYGDSLDISQFAKYIERYLRLALTKAAREAPVRGPLVNWDGLVLGST